MSFRSIPNLQQQCDQMNSFHSRLRREKREKIINQKRMELPSPKMTSEEFYDVLKQLKEHEETSFALNRFSEVIEQTNGRFLDLFHHENGFEIIKEIVDKEMNNLNNLNNFNNNENNTNCINNNNYQNENEILQSCLIFLKKVTFYTKHYHWIFHSYHIIECLYTLIINENYSLRKDILFILIDLIDSQNYKYFQNEKNVITEDVIIQTILPLMNKSFHLYFNSNQRNNLNENERYEIDLLSHLFAVITSHYQLEYECYEEFIIQLFSLEYLSHYFIDGITELLHQEKCCEKLFHIESFFQRIISFIDTSHSSVCLSSFDLLIEMTRLSNEMFSNIIIKMNLVPFIFNVMKQRIDLVEKEMFKTNTQKQNDMEIEIEENEINQIEINYQLNEQLIDTIKRTRSKIHFNFDYYFFFFGYFIRNYTQFLNQFDFKEILSIIINNYQLFSQEEYPAIVLFINQLFINENNSSIEFYRICCQEIFFVFYSDFLRMNETNSMLIFQSLCVLEKLIRHGKELYENEIYEFNQMLLNCRLEIPLNELKYHWNDEIIEKANSLIDLVYENDDEDVL